MSGARTCLGYTSRDRTSLLKRTLAVARLACTSTQRHTATTPALAVLARPFAPPTRPASRRAAARLSTQPRAIARGKAMSYALRRHSDSV